MINYTNRLTLLMRDIVSRVPALAFVDVDDLLVFARPGRSDADGALATCHCLSLPPSEPGYYFWRDRESGRITRRSDWFVTKSPVVTIGARTVKYMVSFALPRFCDQSLARSRKERFYRRASDAWIAKLDTVVHELYHIDPDQNGIRRITRGDGTYLANCHSQQFFEEVAALVTAYLDTRPDPGIFDFLKDDFDRLEARHAGIVGTAFRTFPSYPQRFVEPLAVQPPHADGLEGVQVEPVRCGQQVAAYTQDDLRIRRFLRNGSQSLAAWAPLRVSAGAARRPPAATSRPS